MTNLHTLRDLKQALAEIPDHWLDTSCTFSLDESTVSDAQPFTMTIIGDTAHFGMSSNPEGPDVWYDFELEELIDAKIDCYSSEAAESEQALLALADSVVDSYENRFRLLEASKGLLCETRPVLAKAFEASCLPVMLEILADGTETEQAIGRAFLWAQKNAERAAVRRV